MDVYPGDRGSETPFHPRSEDTGGQPFGSKVFLVGKKCEKRQEVEGSRGTKSGKGEKIRGTFYGSGRRLASTQVKSGVRKGITSSLVTDFRQDWWNGSQTETNRNCVGTLS